MPEAPEVKLIVDQLSPLLSKQTIVKATILNGKYLSKFQIPHWNHFLHSLPNQIVSFQCHGKFLWIQLANGFAIGIGLGMSGRLHLTPTPHNHIQLELDNGLTVCFDDQRRFGNWAIHLTPASLQTKINQLGISLLHSTSDELQLAVQKLYPNHLSKNICVFLMSQDLIAGIGNYLVSESLYQMTIHPLCKVSHLTVNQLIELIQVVQAIALQSYQVQSEFGATYRNTQQTTRSPSKYRDVFQIYGKTMDPLGNPVRKIKTPNGRNTSYVVETLPIIDDRISI